MPTYDYRCESCGHEFEHFQSITARRLRECPECGEHALKRLIGAGAGVFFRGSGFYETDYVRKSSTAASKTGTSNGGSSSSSSSSSSDSSGGGSSSSGGDSGGSSSSDD